MKPILFVFLEYHVYQCYDSKEANSQPKQKDGLKTYMAHKKLEPKYLASVPLTQQNRMTKEPYLFYIWA